MKQDLVNRRFGRWVVLSRAPYRGTLPHWRCRCDCGTERDVLQRSLLKGLSTSCGCHRAEAARSRALKHGKSHSRAWNIWNAMIQRCTNPNSTSFANYGARGVHVCPAWRDFEVFYRDMGDPPAGASIDRVDSSGHYAPDNCRWATREDQANNKRSTILITHQGRTQGARQWQRELGFSYAALYRRIRAGLTPEAALEEVLRRVA